MAQLIRGIPIEHHSAIYPIDSIDGESPDSTLNLTLLELVQAVSEVCESEREIVGTVVYMLRSGRIRLAGNFRDCAIDDLCD